MNDVFVMDACALIAVLASETGADVVRGVIDKAAAGSATVVINKLNLLEVYYDVYRKYGVRAANEFVETVKNSPIRVQAGLSDEVFAEAGRLKATYKISLADSVALAEAMTSCGMLLTSDHHEFDAIEAAEKIKLFWIR